MNIVENWASTYPELIEKLHAFGDEALDKFLSSIEIAGDSSFQGNLILRISSQ